VEQTGVPEATELREVYLAYQPSRPSV